MGTGRFERVAAAALLSLFAAACGAATDLSEAAFTTDLVGEVEGTDVVVSALAGHGEVVFYACGGPTTFATASRWFTGSVAESGVVELEEGGWRVTGDLRRGTGELVAPDGASARWSARPVAADTLEGLYDATDEGCRTGAVITQPSTSAEPALQGTWCGDGGSIYAQVTPILPIERTASGVPVRVMTPSGERLLDLRRLPRP